MKRVLPVVLIFEITHLYETVGLQIRLGFFTEFRRHDVIIITYICLRDLLFSSFPPDKQ